MIEQKMAVDNLAYKVVVGSNLYGTEKPESDLDYLGIFIPPKQYVYGFQKCDQVISNEVVNNRIIDYTCYSLPKFFHLATKNNPNIVSMFFAPENRISEINCYGRKIIEAKDLFISMKAYHTFRGYAHEQKRKLLTKVPEGSRTELVKMYGFDTKFAMHLIRLYLECLELMVEGKITYPSPHRKKLKGIRYGEVGLAEVLSEARRLEELIDLAYVKTSLPHDPDRKKLEQLQMSILESFWADSER